METSPIPTPSSSTNNPWMAVSLGLLGIIIGYGIATYTSAAPRTELDSGAGVPSVPSVPSALRSPPTPPSPPAPPPSVPIAPPRAPAASRPAKDLTDDDPAIGEADAPVVIVEWLDYQCPFCGRFFTQTLGQIKSQYVDTGKVRFVVRDFPLDSIHPNARPASIATECADDQGKFWEYHDALFAQVSSWANNPTAAEAFKKIASELGLSAAAFGSCLDNRTHDSEVSKDLADGSSSGCNGTPCFIVGNQLLSGAQPFSSFQAAIEAQLGS